MNPHYALRLARERPHRPGRPLAFVRACAEADTEPATHPRVKGAIVADRETCGESRRELALPTGSTPEPATSRSPS